MMKIGDKVEHRSRPDVGVGVIVEINNENCTVEFPNSKFSGISINTVIYFANKK